MSRPAPHHHTDQVAEACPYCGQEITHEELLAIEARLEKEQQAKFDALTKRLNAKHLAEVSDLRKTQAEKERSAQERLKSIEERHRVELKNRDQATDKQVAKALKTARTDELGDGAEVDLYNDLKRAFPDDVIVRVKRGVAGADIKHEIHVEGRVCGKIVYDSKNRGDWKTAYAEQLRKDQMAEKADYAILGTRKFPRHTREMTIRNGVILVNPGRATVIAGLLRNALVQLSSVKLSETGKHEKRRALYDYVTSTRCATLFTRVEDQVADLRGLDEQERTQQERMRKNRAKHVGEIEKAVIGELQREIHTILGL